MVNANLGEGFGLIPREFAATGGPTLATNWGGTADDIDEWGIPIPYNMAPAWKGHDVHEGLGEWAEPDVDALATLMREVSDYRGLFAELAMEKAPRLHELYSWRNFARGVYEVWKEYASQPAMQTG
jgi:glycosyltransferase involved in cell wall biosynthesis